MNKKQIAIMENWKRATADDLNDVYKTYSDAKRRSFNNIWFEYRNNKNAHELRILSANCNFYTCGYLYDIVDEMTGEITDIRFRYFTHTRTDDFSCLDWYNNYLKEKYPYFEF